MPMKRTAGDEGVSLLVSVEVLHRGSLESLVRRSLATLRTGRIFVKIVAVAEVADQAVGTRSTRRLSCLLPS